MTQLKPGDPAPDFSLKDGDGRTWRLSELEGERVLLYFYPADDTPGCTAQACDFRDSQEPFAHAGYTVLGVSPQDEGSHQAFAGRYGLNFPLLVDDGHEVAERYGAWGDRKNHGETSQGIIRSTFVIDARGHIERAQYNVEARGHVGRLRKLLEV